MINNVVEFVRNELAIGIDVDIDVDLLNLEDEGVKGWCFGMDGEYTIELDCNLPADEMALTLCHEMVHVRQYETTGIADEDEAYDLENILFERVKDAKLV